ncbi:MAG: Gfo/Idh/MocA family protein [Candidatus Kapaibacterium sp.]
MKIAVVGCGYWGKHLIRNFSNSASWELKYICDREDKLLEKYSGIYPNVKGTANFDDLIKDNDLDAIAIATPVSSHYELAMKSIEAGKHTWVEKPLCSSSKEGRELIEAAQKHNVLLHVDHTYIYTPAVRKIKEIVNSRQIGDINYIDSVRINLGLFQHDVNVLWDLAPHDISITEFISGKKPVSVNAIGKAFHRYSDRDIESIAYLTVEFEDGSMAHYHVNWMSPVKIRHIIIGGTEKMLVFNDMEPMSKIKIYDSGVNVENHEDIYETLIQYRTGDMFSPAIRNDEALEVECDHFYDSIKNNKKTDTPGESGLYVVKILEAANESIKRGGEKIRIEM